ncbi:MAG TPA: HDIG domain-containing protein [Pyrinomonadaceae bacterium]|jgi:hypothetical protein
MRRKRRPKFTSSVATWRDAALLNVARSFRWFRPTTRFIIGFAALTLTTTLLLARMHTPMPDELYHEGDVVRSTIIAPADIAIEDARETDRRRNEATDATRPVWNYNPARGEVVVQEFRASWERLRQQTEPTGNNSNVPNSNSSRSDTKNATRQTTWTGEAGQGGDEAARAIVAHRFDAGALERLTSLLREITEGYVYEDRDAPYIKPEIRIIDARTNSLTDIITAQNRLVSLSVARQTLRDRLSQLAGWTPAEREALASTLVPTLAPTLLYNEAATNAARTAAARAVAPSTITLKRNQVVARDGDTVTAQMLAQFAAIRAYSNTERRPHHFIGLLFIVAALYGAAWRFTEYRSTITALPISQIKSFALVASAILIELVLMRIGFILAESSATQAINAPFNDPTMWSFAIPFAAAALLIALLVDTQLALITGFLTAIFAGLLAHNGMLTTCYAMVSSSAAIYGIGRYRERQSVTLAGLIVGAVNAVMALAVILSAQQPLTLRSVLLAVVCGAAGGLLTTIFTAGGLPVNESMFGILTDIKLLELSNADLPVLGQLALRAPGTNQHSHAVGQLAEEACRAIGANPLLARIGALYHDIGKTAAPDMFVENQTGDNPHDRLKPTQSARIITSHVTYGLKLAKEIGLPKQISDFIPQHHGTRTLHYFLRKAQAQAAEGEVIDEAEFRYPGPKPQFKEAAIMMLADSCEAAARSLARPDPENIRTIINKIFDAIVSDGQLDECDLSLRELTKVRESIIISLVAIYHARIDYPGFNPPSLPGTMPALPLPELDTEERGISYSRPSDIPISKGGEVEDEAVTRKS